MNKILAITLAFTMISAEGFGKSWSRSAARSSGKKTGNTMGAQLSGNAQAGKTTENAQHDSLQQSSQDNLKNSQKGQSTAMMMAGALGAAAAVKFGICSGSFFTGLAACVAGAILLGMAMQSKDSADSFDGPIDAAYNNICTFNNQGCAGTPKNPYDDVVKSSQSISQSEMDNMQKILKSKGIDVDPRTGIVKTADGKTVNPSDFSSLSAALGEDEAVKLMEEVATMEKNAIAKLDQVKPSALAGGGFEGGGGGGDLGSGAGFEDGGGAAGALGAVAAQGKNTRKPAQLSGLSKNFNGDPIGVAADSIFDMMSRRYQLKHNQKTFLGKEFQ